MFTSATAAGTIRLMAKSNRETRSIFEHKELVIALLGAGATVLAALISGFFGLIQPPSPGPVLAPPANATTAPVPTPSVAIEGPLTAPLGEQTYYTILSSDAQRAEWSIGGFGDNATYVVEPLSASHQIYVEPTNASRVGETFIIVVTVYGREGQSATATRVFEVIAR